MDKTEARAIIKCLKKRDDLKILWLFNCYSTLLFHHIQSRLTIICSLNSNHTFLVVCLETIRVLEECLRGQGAVVFIEVNAMHEYLWTKCNDVKGDYIKKKCKAVSIVPPFLAEAYNFLNDPRIHMRAK